MNFVPWKVQHAPVRCVALVFAIAALIGPLPGAAAQKAPGVDPIRIDDSEQQIQQAVSTVRAGRKLTPKSWAKGARVAVCLSFDVDNESLWTETPLPVPLSEGEYGATIGLPRILALLDQYQIPATFYIPVMSAMLHPSMIPEAWSNRLREHGGAGYLVEQSDPPRHQYLVL